ncbi:MAG: diacylglycerol/polyprenol kinase family protein [Candidatus Helarchaeota archaeon]
MVLVPNYGLYTIGIGIELLILVPLIVYMGKKVYDRNAPGGWTPFLLAGLCVFFAIKLIHEGLVIYSITANYIAIGTEEAYIDALEYALVHSTFPYPIGCFILYFTSFIFIFFFAYFIKEKYVSKNFDTKEKIESVKSTKIHYLDLEISRKLFHICIIAVLIGYLMLGELIGMGIFNSTVNLYSNLPPVSYIPYDQIDFQDLLTNHYFSFVLNRWLVVFISMVIGILLLLSEFLRYFNFRYYPIKTIDGVYREKEKNAMGPHVYLVMGICFVALVLPPPIAMSAIAISGLADAVATIVGITIGKKKVHKGSSKTWAGCIAGFISALFFGMFSYFILLNKYTIPGLLETYYPGFKQFNIAQGIISSIVGALVFFLIDYFSPPMHFSDNILNPLLCGLSMYFVGLII